MGAAALFAIAQGATAWFSADAFTKKAEDTSKRIEDIEKEIRSNFPNYERGEKFRREAYAVLHIILGDGEGLDWRDNFYERFEFGERQKLLSVERHLGIELSSRPENDPSYPWDLRRLANFYVSKFQFENRHGYAYYGDLERAEYYLHLALDQVQFSKSFKLLNDLGLLQLQYYEASRHPERWKYLIGADGLLGGPGGIQGGARGLLQESLRMNPNQQRANYNLSVVNYCLANNRNLAERLNAKAPEWIGKYLQQAIECLQQAEKEQSWEESEVEAMRGNVLYNLACYSARMAVQDPNQRTQMIKTCQRAFGACAQIGKVRPSTAENDFKDRTPKNGDFWGDGDFYRLVESTNQDFAHLATLLREKRHKLSAKYTPPAEAHPPKELPPDTRPPSRSFRNRLKFAWCFLTQKS